jgi:transposase-like protein
MTKLTDKIFHDEDAARAHFERIRWPEGRTCPHCGTVDNSTLLKGKSTRPGLYKCRDCRKPFTATMGTIYERSHIPLHKWLLATHLMVSSKKGISAMQLHRNLGFGSYRTAWFMAHRIREAMKAEPSKMLGGPGSSGIVEADETFWGAQADEEGIKYPKGIKRGFSDKMKIVSLVERDGEKRSFHVPNVNAATLGPILKAQIASTARLMTDEAAYYKKAGKHFASHESVNHSRGEYARGDVTSNTAESSFAILKRGLTGTFHSVSEKHLQRYCVEFDFRWNTRQSQGFSDAMRADMALKGITGKRLTYRRINPPVAAFQ